MKTLKIILLTAIITITAIKVQTTFAQGIIDTTLINSIFDKAEAFEQIDSAIAYYNKTIELCQIKNLKNSENLIDLTKWTTEKHLASINQITSIYIKQWDLTEAITLADSTIKYANNTKNGSSEFAAHAFYSKALVYYYQYNPDEALRNYKEALSIRLNLYGEKNLKIASIYHNIGLVFFSMAEYDKAIEHYMKDLKITTELLGERNTDVAQTYINIGNSYNANGNFEEAMKYYRESLEIQKENSTKEDVNIAMLYNNIGIVFEHKMEYDKALAYYSKCLVVMRKELTENHAYTAMVLDNIGNIYKLKLEYEKAIVYIGESLKMSKSLFGEKHISVSNSYTSIGIIYRAQKKQDKALEYFSKSLEMYREIIGENNTKVANSYFNIGDIYIDNQNYDKALEYHLKCLKIRELLLHKKHYNLAVSYNLIGNLYSFKNEFNLALQYFQKSLCSNLSDFSDSVNVASNPIMQNYIYHDNLLNVLQGKSEIFETLANNDSLLNQLPESLKLSGSSEYLEMALQNYQMCDTVIEQTRQRITQKSDKIALGETAVKVYEGAIDVCMKLAQLPESSKFSGSYLQQAFYFAEKNKSSVLQSSLAQANALQFSGLPDSLVEKEKTLQTEIALYTQKLAEQPDSAKKVLYQSKLFGVNRSYEALTATLENDFPEYYNLKYNTKQATVENLQNALNKKTAIISYFIGDSTITVFTLTKKNLDVQQIKKMDDFDIMAEMYPMRLKVIGLKDPKLFTDLSYKLYNQLFPMALPDKIENLIIIPDGVLSTFPFETLLTTNLQGFQNLEGLEWKNLPYLIKKYNISYAYSTNLWYNGINPDRVKNPVRVENDLLTIAPIFDDNNTASASLRTRSLLADIDSIATVDTIRESYQSQTRGMLLNGSSVSALPSSEDEVQAIYDLFRQKKSSAMLKTRLYANEAFVKSDTISRYKYIHIATHGFVNSEKPELSGIILAQDSTINEDGILYSGEIYNLKLNADLVVLSACETGLGQMKKGEGVIGLTRALMYAGSKNIIVSLWKVADKSTSDLMIDFYSLMLNDKKHNYSKAIRKAKLKMIAEGEFSHPFYWSPFVLIGN